MIEQLVFLFQDLTESRCISVRIADKKISILIISDWFKLQNQNERLDYLAEGILVAYPEFAKTYAFHFIALTPDEARQLACGRLAS